MPVNRYKKKPDLADIIQGLNQRLKSIERRSIGGVASASSFMQEDAPWPDEGPGGDHATAVGTLWIDPSNANNVKRWSDQGQWASATLESVPTDGNVPDVSPDAICLSGIGNFILKWTPILNHDPVKYQIHVSTTLGFTATKDDPTTLVGETGATQFTVKRLPGPMPDEGDPDPYALDYDTTYYARIIAYDDDGPAPMSNQTVCNVFRVTGVDIQADSITAANILAGTLTGDLFAATVIMAGTFKTAETGQRVEMGFAGITGYKSDGSLMVSIPTADGHEMTLDGEFIARKITVTGQMSLVQGGTMQPSSVLVLARGVQAPSVTPIIGVSYDFTHPDTTSLPDANKTGVLGTFDLVPTEVTYIEWKDAATDYWSISQVRSNGTRSWFFRVSDGAPTTVGGVYFNDYPDWAYYSVWQINSGAHAGVYRMGRWIPSGTANTYYLSSPNGGGLNRYSRQNGVAAPAIGSDGTDIFVAEVPAGDNILRVRYFVPTGTGENLASPTATYETPLGYNEGHGLCTILYDAAGFDIGTARYAVAEKGWSTNARLLNLSGTTLYPGGSGNNWASANKEAESWESPVGNRRAFAWDPANGVFWTYGSDGYMYKHTTERWDPAVSSSTYWAKQTYYDNVGTTHETNSSDTKFYTAYRRSLNTFSPAALPPSPGADDPNRVRLYMARGNTAPANSAYHLQAEVTGNTSFQTLATVTANPPTTNNFPAGTPALIENDNTDLIISGDGTINAKQVFVGAVGSRFEVIPRGPYWYGWVDTGQGTIPNNTATTITSYTTEATNGITISSGLFTLPIAGRYLLIAQLYWPSQGSPAGQRIANWTLNSPLTTLVSHTAIPSALGNCVSGPEKVLPFSAGDQVFVRASQTSGAALAPLNTTRDLSFASITYIGPT